ncbi:hypothetical protein CEY16_02975 [Halalkalibacillus sediminis]|uniref:GH18 domain-containing protein n=1 Tax=Halalkalibacillus sediminis TaxID=2018042 RepID=A0A2I0QWM9_9BACI|nr:glycosyl hydrolase family 18 protein [Halalkalibacillus sediminis]PKR78735.1 hypothetical protein CEY16_02975 [Halalkalibacillus sediminis]
MSTKSRSTTSNTPNLKTSLLIISLLAGALVVAFYFYLQPSDQFNEYINEQNSIMIDQETIEENFIFHQDKIYIPVVTAQQHIDDRIYYNERDAAVILTTGTKVIEFPLNDFSRSVNREKEESDYSPAILDREEAFISVEQLQDIYGLAFEYLPQQEQLYLVTAGNELISAQLSEDTDLDDRRVRHSPNYQSSYFKEVEDDEFWVIEQANDFYRILLQSGEIGHLPEESVSILKTSLIEPLNDPFEPVEHNIDKPLHMSWDAMYQSASTPDNAPSLPGVDVISPTWFHLTDSEGNIRDYGKKSYVESAQEQGKEVWALFSNDFDPDRTSAVFKSFEKRSRVIDQLLEKAETYQLDGLNIDIENVNYQDQDLVTQFIRELVPLAHNKGLVVSMDITFLSMSGNWSLFYDREELVQLVDYLVVMAYDQHPARSTVAGSVAELDWVDRELDELLQVVPNDQLILGVPLYTRLWTETDSEVSSEVFSMDEAKQWTENQEEEVAFDEDAGQDYLFVEESNESYKLWLENSQSISSRIELVKKYDLPGIATWEESFANESIWPLIKEKLDQYRESDE